MKDNKKFEEAKTIIQEWIDKQGHDRCWYYPELFNKLVKVFEINLSKKPNLPPLEEFKKGCERYQKEEYSEIKINNEKLILEALKLLMRTLDDETYENEELTISAGLIRDKLDKALNPKEVLPYTESLFVKSSKGEEDEV